MNKFFVTDQKMPLFYEDQGKDWRAGMSSEVLG